MSLRLATTTADIEDALRHFELVLGVPEGTFGLAIYPTKTRTYAIYHVSNGRRLFDNDTHPSLFTLDRLRTAAATVLIVRELHQEGLTR